MRRRVTMSALYPAVYVRTPAQRIGLAMAVAGVVGLMLTMAAIAINGRTIDGARQVAASTDDAQTGSSSQLLESGPLITWVSDNKSDYPNGEIPRYEKFEVSFTVGNVGTAFTDYNPFNPNTTQLSGDYWNKPGILVDALLTSPSGQSITYPCFWYEGTDGWKGWKLRFAPMETGIWRYKIRARHSSGESIGSEYTFNCVTSSSHGFIRVNPVDTRVLRYSDGTPFHPLGMGTEGYYAPGWIGKHEEIFPKLHANGGNFVRLMVADGFGSGYQTNIEAYWDDTSKPKSTALNNYKMDSARYCDQTVDLAKQYGIYCQWMLDDWTWFKGGAGAYISAGGVPAPCANYLDVFNGVNHAREIYERKLRYVAARWGYSTQILSWEFINEYYGNDFQGVHDWHKEMGNMVHGTFRPAYLPAGYNQDLQAQPHLFTSSTGNYRVRLSSGVPWNDPALDVVNYHNYSEVEKWGGGLVTWSTVEADNYTWEKLGSNLPAPWYDHAVLVDRTSRIAHKRWKWPKPYVWGEFGLGEWHPDQGKSTDWDAAYTNDTQARNQRDAMWAGIFCYVYPLQWKAAWMLGKAFNTTEKFWIFKPASTYLAGEDFTGLKQETYYPVSDPINPSPQIKCSNPNIMVISLHGPNKAYFYVKNLTDVWYRIVNPSACPTPSNQSGTVQILGLEPGTYTLEKWSTYDTNPATQKQSSSTITVGTDGVATISVSVGTGRDWGYDWAYKLKKGDGTPTPQPALQMTMSADRSSIKPGETITYTVTYKNTGTDTATNAVVSVQVPANTTYVAGSGGTLSGNAIKWTVPSVAPGVSGTVSFKATVN